MDDPAQGDIVGHLRYPGFGTERYWMYKAASEIEQLRALLKDIVAYWPATTSALCERARAEVAKADADGQ